MTMKGFYEKNREDDRLPHIRRGTRHTYAAHFHRNLEVFIMKRGKYRVTVNENEYELTDGQVAVVDSYDIHAYTQIDESGDDCVVIVPYEYLHAFNARRKGMRVKTPVIADGRLVDELLTIVERYMQGEGSEWRGEAAIGLFLAVLGEKLEWTEARGKDEGALIRSILSYIHDNYRGELTRSGIARALGYTEAHVSRVFHRYQQTSIAEYVNGLRLEYIDRMRKNGDDRTTIELIYDAGFKSQQTYYRCKKAKKHA